jgi:undecaprenyl-diphosphatase
VAAALNVVFGTIGGILLVIAILIALAVTGRRRRALLTLAVILAGWWIGTLFKVAIARPRPPAAHQLVAEAGRDSFPSGHVCLTLSIVIALTLLARRTALFGVLVVAGTLLVAAQMLARVYLGVHYPTDTLGSLLVTTAAVTFLCAFGPFQTAGQRTADPPQAGTDPPQAGTDPSQAGTDPPRAGTDPHSPGPSR